MKDFMRKTEEENTRTQETLHLIQKQLEQIINTIDSHNGK